MSDPRLLATYSKLLLVTLESQQVILVDLRRRKRRRRQSTETPSGAEGAENGGQSSAGSRLYGFNDYAWHTHELRIDLGAVYEQEQRRRRDKESQEGGEGQGESQG